MNRFTLHRWLIVSMAVSLVGSKAAFAEDDGAPEKESKVGEVAIPGANSGKGKGKGNKGKGSSRDDSREEVKGGSDSEGGDTGAGNGGTVDGMAGPGSGNATFVTIIGVRGDRITLVSEGEASAGMGGGKGKGKGRSRDSADSSSETQPVAEDALITTATKARRTGELLIGSEISGGLGNELFESEVQARVVREEGRIVEINVILPGDESNAPIAVKPRRPPSKRGL